MLKADALLLERFKCLRARIVLVDKIRRPDQRGRLSRSRGFFEHWHIACGRRGEGVMGTREPVETQSAVVNTSVVRGQRKTRKRVGIARAGRRLGAYQLVLVATSVTEKNGLSSLLFPSFTFSEGSSQWHNRGVDSKAVNFPSNISSSNRYYKRVRAPVRGVSCPWLPFLLYFLPCGAPK